LKDVEGKIADFKETWRGRKSQGRALEILARPNHGGGAGKKILLAW